MLKILRRYAQERQVKQKLLAFLTEMEKNLELFYVIDQRQFITGGFYMQAWEVVKDFDMIKRQESLAVYAKTLEGINQSYKAHKEFERWYTSDLKHKTPETAKKLHAMKHDLDWKVKGLDGLIIPAGQALEKEMLNLGYLRS